MNPSSSLYNADLAPTPLSKRVWGRFNFATVWMGMVHNILAYEIAGSLIALGMSATEAIFTIIIGNVILLVPMFLNGYVGTKYGIPFPVLIRSSFGVKGANIPAVLRGFVAIGWFGVQTYAASTAMNALLGVMIPGWTHLGGSFMFLGMNLPGWITYLLTWGLNVVVILHGMDSIRHFEAWAGPLVLIVALGLIGWSINVSHGFGPLFSLHAHFASGNGFSKVFVTSVTGIIGVWATLALNIPDFTRFSKNQKEQMLGQVIGLPGTAAIFAVMSVLITSGTIVAFGKPIWNPVTLLTEFHNPLILAFGAAALTIASISVNVAANIVSPAYDMTNLFPRKLNFVSAGVIAAVISFAMMPWQLMKNPTVIFDLLNGIGGVLGPVAGVMIADFWLLRKRRLDVDQLYQEQGEYTFAAGYNYRAMVALGIGILMTVLGFVVPAVGWMYSYSWFVGLGMAFVVYYVLNKIHPPVAAGYDLTEEPVIELLAE